MAKDPEQQFRDALHETLIEYPTPENIGSGTDFEKASSDHYLYQLVVNEAGDAIRELIDTDTYEVKASVGRGSPTYIPYVAVMDADETTSPREGRYVVYLFDPVEQTLYLTLNQGANEAQNLASNSDMTSTEILRARAEAQASEINAPGFRKERLEFETPSRKGELYGAGTICYKSYTPAEFPDAETVVDDLQTILDIYDDIVLDSPPEIGTAEPVTDDNDVVTDGNDGHGAEQGQPHIEVPEYVDERYDRIARALLDAHQVVFYGPPGTGKTYTAQHFARWWLNQEPAPAAEQLRVVTFHPSFSYEDFIEGITTNVRGGGVEYEIEAGVFKTFCEAARQAYEQWQAAPEDFETNHPPRFVLIIDEINRGNLAQIFGETITLLESDKRGSLSPNLAHSDEPFTIPENVYIIGTMNTADRSIALLDAALRRRFRFMHFPPDTDVLYEEYGFGDRAGAVADLNEGDLTAVEELQALSILAVEELNERIRTLGDLGKGKQIGHSYLLGVAETEAAWVDTWRLEILPLLEEYFFGQFDRLQAELFDGNGGALINWEEQVIRDFQAGSLRESLATIADADLSPEY